MNESPITVLIPSDVDRRVAIEKELTKFDSFFATLQTDMTGMVGFERNLLRTYLVWATGGKPERRES